MIKILKPSPSSRGRLIGDSPLASYTLLTRTLIHTNSSASALVGSPVVLLLTLPMLRKPIWVVRLLHHNASEYYSISLWIMVTTKTTPLIIRMATTMSMIEVFKRMRSITFTLLETVNLNSLVAPLKSLDHGVQQLLHSIWHHWHSICFGSTVCCIVMLRTVWHWMNCHHQPAKSFVSAGGTSVVPTPAGSNRYIT